LILHKENSFKREANLHSLFVYLAEIWNRVRDLQTVVDELILIENIDCMQIYYKISSLFLLTCWLVTYINFPLLFLSICLLENNNLLVYKWENVRMREREKWRETKSLFINFEWKLFLFGFKSIIWSILILFILKRKRNLV
jgi:hypothetical protein